MKNSALQTPSEQVKGDKGKEKFLQMFNSFLTTHRIFSHL